MNKYPHFAIPEIYGESLSYYEVLRKLVNAMNVMIENYDTIPDQIAEAVANLDASQLFSAVLNQLIHSIATDNTKSTNAVKVYKKHDLLYATFNDTVNLYESLIDFTTGTETELIVGSNIREVNISELFIEIRKLIEDEAQAREQADQLLHTNISNEAQAREQADQLLHTNISNEAQAREHADNENSVEIAAMRNEIKSVKNKNTEQDNELSTLRTMISSPYNFKGEVSSISALPASGHVNDTYYVQDVKYKVTWTGSAWVQSSMSEADYQTELSELTGDIASSNELNYEMYEYSENRFFIENMEENKYITNTGNILDYPGWNLSDYLPVEKNEIYWWTFYSDKKEVYHVVNIYYGLYDVNRNWIGAGTTQQGSQDGATFVQTDNNTAYVRISQASKYFTNTNMLIKRSLIESGLKTFIQFKRYLKNSPTKEIEEKTDSFETNYLPGYDNVVRSIQRIGDGMSYPIHSVDAFKEAYKKGFRILLCDLIFTSDNIPVCNHDSYLNQYYKNVFDSNGNLVSTDNPIYFAQNTYETLSQYSYGAVGYPLLKFTDMLKLVKQLGVELYVEIKGMTELQSKIACSLVEKYGLSDKTSWCGTTQQMKWIVANIDTARVSTMPRDINDSVIADLNLLKTGKNKVFIFGWDKTVLSDEIVNKLIRNNIAFEQGTLDTNEDIINYFNRGDIYYYCTGVETNSVVAGKILMENSLSN